MEGLAVFPVLDTNQTSFFKSHSSFRLYSQAQFRIHPIG